MTQPPKPLSGQTPPEPEGQPRDTQVPVFDQAANEPPWPRDNTLNVDEEGNVLPGNDPLEDDPNDTGVDEQPDLEDLGRMQDLDKPVVE